MATNNSKPAAELRIGTVKATVWENGVSGITRHSVTFRASTVTRASGRPRTASASRTCSCSSSSSTKRTRSSPSARPRRPQRPAMTAPKLRTFRRRVQPRRLFGIEKRYGSDLLAIQANRFSPFARLYTRAMLRAERPSVLFDRATARLAEGKEPTSRCHRP